MDLDSSGAVKGKGRRRRNKVVEITTALEVTGCNVEDVSGCPYSYTLPLVYVGSINHKHPSGAIFCSNTGVLLKCEIVGYNKEMLYFGNVTVHPIAKEAETHDGFRAFIWIPQNLKFLGFYYSCKICNLNGGFLTSLSKVDYLTVAGAIYDGVNGIASSCGFSHKFRFSVKTGDSFFHWKIENNSVFQKERIFHPTGCADYVDNPCFGVAPSVIVNYNNGLALVKSIEKGFSIQPINENAIVEEGGFPALMVCEGSACTLGNEHIIHTSQNGLSVTSQLQVGYDLKKPKKVFVKVDEFVSPQELVFHPDITCGDIVNEMNDFSFSGKIVQFRDNHYRPKTICALIHALQKDNNQPVETNIGHDLWLLASRKYKCLYDVVYMCEGCSNCPNGRIFCMGVSFEPGRVLACNDLPLFRNKSNSECFLIYSQLLKLTEVMNADLWKKLEGAGFSPFYYVAKYCHRDIVLTICKLLTEVHFHYFDELSTILSTTCCLSKFFCVNPDSLGIGKFCVEHKIIAEDVAHDLWLSILEQVCSEGVVSMSLCCILRDGIYNVVTSGDEIVGTFKTYFRQHPVRHKTVRSGECIRLVNKYLLVDSVGVFTSRNPGSSKIVEGYSGETIRYESNHLTKVWLEGSDLLTGFDSKAYGYEFSKDGIKVENFKVVSDVTKVGVYDDTYHVYTDTMLEVLRKFCFLGSSIFLQDMIGMKMKGKAEPMDVNWTCKEHSGNVVLMRNLDSNGFKITVDCLSVIKCELYAAVCSKLEFFPTEEQYWFFVNSKDIRSNVKLLGDDFDFLNADE
jgi:hypothetical protein